jgi:hypothetical protein
MRIILADGDKLATGELRLAELSGRTKGESADACAIKGASASRRQR